MESIDYFRSTIAELHQNLLEAIEGLTDEQLHFPPQDKGNHIAFTLWHCIRTEDLVVNLVLQKKRPVWNEGQWDERFGLDSRAQGTGMSTEEAAAVRIKDLQGFSQYMSDTYSATNAFLTGLTEEDLDEVRDQGGMGKRSVREMIGGTLTRHGIGHLSEIWYIKGLQGLEGSPV